MLLPPFPANLIPAIRLGYFTAVYFNRAKQIAGNKYPNKRVTMQIFQKNDDVVVCGIKEVIELLKLAAGGFKDYKQAQRIFNQYLKLKKEESDNFKVSVDQATSFKHQSVKPQTHHDSPALKRLEEQLNEMWIPQYHELSVKALAEGSTANAWETVMHIEGPYSAFAHLESLYLGILARRTKVATNVRRAVKAANGKPVLFFTDRFDHFLNQPGDGYAAKVGGAHAVCTEAMGSWIEEAAVGTIPHALIALFDGDTVKATKAFADTYPDVSLIALVDFDNDSPKTALRVARALGKKLWGVRLDTATTMVDKSLIRNNQMGEIDPRGVNPTLVLNVRKALDKAGFRHVKVIVSGGFTPSKIKFFEQQNCPVDGYGIGSYFLKGNFDYTADVVKVEGKNIAKQGRWYRPNKRLQLYTPGVK